MTLANRVSPPLWVVKLGGSLWRSDSLPDWLAGLVSENARGRCICVVPGGGVFADTVRAAQRRFAFPDETAHDMALLGMRQYGLMLRGMRPELTVWDGGGESWPEGGPARIWLPPPYGLGWAGLKRNWEATSDSLALRLAVDLAAERLWLLKTPSPGSSPTRPADLVDGAFGGQWRRFAKGLPVHWLGADDHILFQRYLQGEPLPEALVW